MTIATPIARTHRAGMVFSGACLLATWGIGPLGTAPGDEARSRFTPLVPLASPKIVASAEAYPGSVYLPQNLVDGNERTEYSSNAKGTATFLVFDFGKPARLAAFEHVDRADPATVAASELVLSDSADFAQARAKFSVRHANTRAGKTFFVFPSPVPARYVRWQVTGLNLSGYGTVGGAEIRFFAAADPEPTPARTGVEFVPLPAVWLTDGRPARILQAKIHYPYAEPADAVMRVAGAGPATVRLSMGVQTVKIPLPSLDTPVKLPVSVEVAGHKVIDKELTLPPVRHWEMYFLSHSHVDIGYTNVQTEIEKLQWKYLDEAMAIARRTAGYPPQARFKWNIEVLWAVDSYLKRATPEKRKEFIDMVKSGQVELDALYDNMLTGLCRPEELMRLFDCSRRLSKECGVTIDAAMISDVPGWTWGIVPAMAQNGVKYFSMGTNHIHRIGYTLSEWGDKPFYWVSPSGQEKVLCWAAGKGYSWFHPGLLDRISKVKPESFLGYLEQLEAGGFPYEMVQLRYSIGGDNGPPDPDLPEFVKKWNAEYVWPKLVIATTSELFREFERRYKDKIPHARGDFTPYWEDGAGSSAKETALTRNAAERLVQAETLWSILNPRGYPAGDFYQAWRNVLLYNEHTWGAHCSITQPDSDFTKAQWTIKQAFATHAATQSQRLLESALAGPRGEVKPADAVDVYNTLSWPRTTLAVVPANLAAAGAVVFDANDRMAPSQVLSSGELAFVATDVPPLGAKRFFLRKATSTARGTTKAEGQTVENQSIRVGVDAATGAIRSLRWNAIPTDLVDLRAGELNEFWYVAGRDPKSPQPSGRAKITAEDDGAVLASLKVESAAPGCRKVTRHVRLVHGLDQVHIVDVIDKDRIRTQEGVHLRFAPNVPNGVIRMDVPWGVIRPEVDQLPGACKNYFSVGRWIDVSNEQFGLTCATIDAPLAEVGAIRTDVANPFDPKVWVKKLDPTQTFYSYVMNNYWETNYKADNEGQTTFRYVLWPHRKFDPAAAARFGVEVSQPLVVVPVAKDAPQIRSMFLVEPPEVILTSLKPSDDKKALMIRLYNAGDRPAKARVKWAAFQPKRVAVSSPREEEGPAWSGAADLPPLGILTLRAERE